LDDALVEVLVDDFRGVAPQRQHTRLDANRLSASSPVSALTQPTTSY
jgi:hypothetical protein